MLVDLPAALQQLHCSLHLHPACGTFPSHDAGLTLPNNHISRHRRAFFPCQPFARCSAAPLHSVSDDSGQVVISVARSLIAKDPFSAVALRPRRTR